MLGTVCLVAVADFISVGAQNPKGLGRYNQLFVITGMTPFLLYTDCALPLLGFPKSQSTLPCCPCPRPTLGHSSELLQLWQCSSERAGEAKGAS